MTEKIHHTTHFKMPFPTEDQIDKCSDLRELDTWMAQFIMGWDDCNFKKTLGLAAGIPPERKNIPRDYSKGVETSVIPYFSLHIEYFISDFYTILKKHLAKDVSQLTIHIKEIQITAVCEFQGDVVMASGSKIGEAVGKLMLKLLSRKII